MKPTNLGIACGENIIIPANAIFFPVVNPGAVPLCVGETLDRGEGDPLCRRLECGRRNEPFVYIYIFFWYNRGNTGFVAGADPSAVKLTTVHIYYSGDGGYSRVSEGSASFQTAPFRIHFVTLETLIVTIFIDYNN